MFFSFSALRQAKSGGKVYFSLYVEQKLRKVRPRLSRPSWRGRRCVVPGNGSEFSGGSRNGAYFPRTGAILRPGRRPKVWEPSILGPELQNIIQPCVFGRRPKKAYKTFCINSHTVQQKIITLILIMVFILSASFKMQKDICFLLHVLNAAAQIAASMESIAL